MIVKHHWHKEIEILYFPGGNFRLEINMETFDISSECFYFINPGELHSIHTLSLENMPEYALVFHPDFLCAPFYDTIRVQLIQPLQNGQLLFPRSVQADSPVFPPLKSNFFHIINAFQNCDFPEVFETINKAIQFHSFRASGTAVVGLTDQLLIKASLLQIFAQLSSHQLFCHTEHSNNHR
ncbi:MAG: AraC family ligand binding domain-containing protein [Ruminococcus sp.]